MYKLITSDYDTFKHSNKNKIFSFHVTSKTSITKIGCWKIVNDIKLSKNHKKYSGTKEHSKHKNKRGRTLQQVPK